MEEKDLKPCKKCGAIGIFVDKTGVYADGYYTGLVSCNKCMPDSEIYPVSEWQGCPCPATREQLVEALKDARKQIYDLSKNFIDSQKDGGWLVEIDVQLSEIDLLLEGELPAADKEGE